MSVALQPFAEAGPPILEPVQDAPPEPASAGFWPRLKNRLRGGSFDA